MLLGLTSFSFIASPGHSFIHYGERDRCPRTQPPCGAGSGRRVPVSIDRQLYVCMQVPSFLATSTVYYARHTYKIRVGAPLPMSVPDYPFRIIAYYPLSSHKRSLPSDIPCIWLHIHTTAMLSDAPSLTLQHISAMPIYINKCQISMELLVYSVV